VLHQIGVGALGPVFRTYEPERDRLVAVKVFRLDITPEHAQELAAALSAVADAGLFHPSIVEPIGAGVESALAYGAEEYVAAESLDVAMRDYAPAPIDTVLPLITQLAGAIDFARAAGVGHGALHPRDVFVTPDEVRVTGFGVVEALERVGLRAPVRRPYSPPERIDGGEWSTPADVFSLAAIAFELLTGRRPAGLGSEIGPLTSGTPNGWADALHAVLVRAMDPDPTRRHGSALAFAAALEAAARGDFSAAGVPAAGALAGFSADATEEPFADVPADDEVSAAPVMAAGGIATDEPDAAWGGPTRELSVGSDHDELRYEPDDEPDYQLPIRADGEADEPLVLQQADVDADDIAIEREDDEAHQRLVLQGMSEPAPRADAFTDPAASPDPNEASDSDAFIAEAAAAAPGTAGDDFREAPEAYGWDLPPEHTEPEPRGLALGLAPDGAFEDVPGTTPTDDAAGAAPEEEWYREDRRRQATDAPVPRSYGRAWPDAERYVEEDEPRDERRTVWVATALLVFGLLGGLALGYLAWGRTPVESGTAADVFLSRDGDGGGAADTADAAVDPARAVDDTPVLPPPAEPPPAVSEAEPPAPAAARPTRGTLVVRSTPSGAGVTVNGRWRGRTPLTLDNLPFARYQVRVVEPGYTVANETVTLSTGSPEGTVAVRLAQQAPPAAKGTQPAGRATQPAAQATGPQAFTGSIYVDSRPRGATVSINGKPVGETPLRIPEMPIGTHVVRLELPNHRIWSSTARVAAGQEARVTGSLDPLR
jgi:hypothetical protein